MTAYAVAHLMPAEPHPDVAEYLERTQSTLDPFGGRFLVHGAPSTSARATGPATW